MSKLLLLFSILLGLSACQGGPSMDKKIDRLLDNPNKNIDSLFGRKGESVLDASALNDAKFSFLDKDAKANLLRAMGKGKDIKTRLEQACQISSPLSDDMRDKIVKIRDDSALTKDQKRQQIKEIMAEAKPKIKEAKKAWHQCLQKEDPQIQGIKAEIKALSSACSVEREHKHKKAGHHGHHGHHDGMRMGKADLMTTEQKTELNNKLKSAECTTALAK